jgi:hypothetical protein
MTESENLSFQVGSGSEAGLWVQDGLSGRASLFLASWFVLALAAQYLGTITSIVWVAGLALQTALAVFLLLKHQFGQL